MVVLLFTDAFTEAVALSCIIHSSSMIESCKHSTQCKKPHAMIMVTAGFGGKVAQALAAHSIHSAQQVSSMKLSALRTLCSTLTEQSAQKLLEYSCGIDHSLPQVGSFRPLLCLQCIFY